MNKNKQPTPIEKEYKKMTEKASPDSRKFINTLKAFVSGGLVCTLGEVLNSLYQRTNLNEEEVRALVPISLIVLTAILTGLGLFGKLAKHTGAGTFVPITGFANSIVSPAMEFQTEGRILGTGAKMFTIAGPVIAYGCGSAALYGFIYYFFIM